MNPYRDIKPENMPQVTTRASRWSRFWRAVACGLGMHKYVEIERGLYVSDLFPKHLDTCVGTVFVKNACICGDSYPALVVPVCGCPQVIVNEAVRVEQVRTGTVPGGGFVHRYKKTQQRGPYGATVTKTTTETVIATSKRRYLKEPTPVPGPGKKGLS